MFQKKTSAALNPHISIDCVIFGYDFNSLNVLIIKRGINAITKNIRKAIPGDLIYDDEDLEMGANRILYELTNMKNVYLEQIGAFGDPHRTETKEDKKWLHSIREAPEARVVTVAFYALVNMKDFDLQASSFAQDAFWEPINMVEDLAFDHNEILVAAKKKLKDKIQQYPIGFNLLPEKFTISQLQKLYEAILEKEIDKRNFRRKIKKLDILTELSEKQKGVSHKPSHFVKFNEENYLKLQKSGFDNFTF